MRVIHIIKVTRISGAEKHLLSLLPGLRAQGLDARLILLTEAEKPLDQMRDEAEALDIPVTRLTIRRDADARLLGALWRVLRRQQPDIVHTHLVHADLFGGLAAKLAGVPCVVSSRHNDDPFRYRARWRRLHRQFWQRLSAGIVISEALRRFAIDIEGAPAHKLTVVHYGMDANWLSDSAVERARRELRAELKLGSDALLMGMVCRLVEQKGIRYALEATRRLRAEFPTARLVIAGDGERGDELRRLASALGIADRVYWLGWREDAGDLMAAFDLLLVPSLWEGFGLVLLEAMARRAPVIASRVSAIPEVVADGETGILIPPRDVDALTAAMARLLSDRALRKHMGLLGAARLEERFSRERMVAGTIAVYTQASQAKR